MAQLRKINSTLTIGGQNIPVKEWSCTESSQGTIGSMQAKGSISDLSDSGVDILATSQSDSGTALDLYAGFDGNMKHAFSGALDEFQPDWDTDTFEVSGRDYASCFFDGKQTVAGLNYRNQTVGQIVQQIADLFGISTNITDPGIMAGPLSNGENVFNPHPQNWWSLIQKMADDVGYECYMTVDKTLYFGPEQDQGSLTVNYGSTQPNPENPLKSCKGRYNPRNNSNIEVQGVSYDRDKGQIIVAKAKANGQALSKGKKSKHGLSAGKIATPSVSSSGKPSSQKSAYKTNVQGLTPDAAQAKCEAVAKDIAKHQVILMGTLEGNLDIKVHTHIDLQETDRDMLGFAGPDYNVAEVTHECSVTGGLWTAFRAQAGGSASAVGGSAPSSGGAGFSGGGSGGGGSIPNLPDPTPLGG